MRPGVAQAHFRSARHDHGVTAWNLFAESREQNRFHLGAAGLALQMRFAVEADGIVQAHAIGAEAFAVGRRRVPPAHRIARAKMAVITTRAISFMAYLPCWSEAWVRQCGA